MANTRTAKVDYFGRTVDILLLKTVLAPESDAVVAPNVAGTPMLATGIEKLVQRYAMLFLTKLGSVKNSSNEGTEFITKMSAGRVYDENTLRSATAEADNLTRRQILDEDEDLDTPDDEALASTEIKDLRIDRSTSTVYVTISITTVAGDTFTYITPIPTGI